MATFANIVPSYGPDGIPYATALVMPIAAADTDLFNQTAPTSPDPTPVLYGAAFLAEVLLTITGGPATNTTYVVAQTSVDGVNWLDVAWLVTTSVSNGTLLFFLAGGVAGSNSLPQTRAVGSAPGSSGSNQVPLGGQLRFVGRTQLTGGTVPKVTATIKVKLLGLR